MTNLPIEPTFDPRCEKAADNRKPCHDCGELTELDDLHTLVCDDKVCQKCYDKLPWFSNCCGYEANGIDLDYQICGDCHDHCEYEK